MSSRIEIELTSRRDDGSWTWRAAGAREPKGTLDGSILPENAATGTTYRAEADFTIDGIDILSVSTTERERKGIETLELLGSGDDEPLVTTNVSKNRDRGDRRKGKGRKRRDGGGDDRSDRSKGKRRERPGRDRPDVPPPPTRPKPPRLKAGRAHRKAFLESLPPEQRPVAEQALKGGVPAVRKAVEAQNAQLEADGKPTIQPDALVSLAESLLPRLRSAEWRDKAEAALAKIDEVDLRDLRSVVTAADGSARDDETRAMAAELRAGLARRIEAEHQLWIDDLTEAITNGRTIRALRLSSRPPKAGTPVPGPLEDGLVKLTNESLTAEVSSDRWIRIIDALAFSPIRSRVVPASLPTKVSRDLEQTLARFGDRLPELAHIFGVEPESASARKKRRAAERKAKQADKAKQASKAKQAAKAKQDKPVKADEPKQGDEAKPDESKPARAEQDEAKPARSDPADEAKQDEPSEGEGPEHTEPASDDGPAASAQPASDEPSPAVDEATQDESAEAETAAAPEESPAVEQTSGGDETASGEAADTVPVEPAQ